MSREVLRDSKNAAAAINMLGGLIGLLEGGVNRGWQKTAHQIIVSEAGTVRLSVAGSNWIHEERKHQQMLAEIRADKQLWSVRYITTAVPYPMSREDQP